MSIASYNASEVVSGSSTRSVSTLLKSFVEVDQFGRLFNYDARWREIITDSLNSSRVGERVERVNPEVIRFSMVWW